MYTRTEDAERHGCRNPIQVGLKLTSSPAIGLMPFQQSKRLSHSEPQLDEVNIKCIYTNGISNSFIQEVYRGAASKLNVSHIMP